MVSWCLYRWLRMGIYSLQWHIQNPVKQLRWTRKTLYLTCSAQFWIHLCIFQNKKTGVKNQIDKAFKLELLTSHKLLMFFLSWKLSCFLGQLQVRIFKYGNKDISYSYARPIPTLLLDFSPVLRFIQNKSFDLYWKSYDMERFDKSWQYLIKQNYGKHS